MPRNYQLLFDFPITQSQISSCRKIHKHIGNLTVRGTFTKVPFDEPGDRFEIDFDAFIFNGKNILPLLEYEESIGSSPLLEEINRAAQNACYNQILETA
jgi:hypothetical protein